MALQHHLVMFAGAYEEVMKVASWLDDGEAKSGLAAWNHGAAKPPELRLPVWKKSCI
jgi:hypothetical protein